MYFHLIFKKSPVCSFSTFRNHRYVLFEFGEKQLESELYTWFIMILSKPVEIELTNRIPFKIQQLRCINKLNAKLIFFI